MNNLEIAYKQNITDAKSILDDMQIFFWLDCGTLLGAIREGRAIVGDEDDIDLVTYVSNKVYLPTIIEKFKEKGFKLLRLRETVVSLERNGNHVDIFFLDKYKDNYYLTLYWKKKPFALVIHKGWLLGFEEWNFYKMDFFVPSDPEGYLELCYGEDWREPLYRPEFQNYNPDHEKRADHNFLKNMSLTDYEERMKDETKACLNQADASLQKEGFNDKLLKINKEQRKFECILCNESHDIDSEQGQKCLNKINRR